MAARARSLIVVLFLICVAVLSAAGGYRYLTQKYSQKHRPAASERVSPSPNITQRSPDLLWGDPAKLMFPDITDPVYVSPQEANEFLDGDEPVFKLTFHDRTRIYPVAIMSYHHIVNDTLDNRPIAFTYCMLSDTPVLFSRNLNGRTLDLGVLGPLYYGNLVMYDKETDDRYIQLTGEKVSTQSAGQLTRLPVRINTLASRDGDTQKSNSLR